MKYPAQPSALSTWEHGNRLESQQLQSKPQSTAQYVDLEKEVDTLSTGVDQSNLLRAIYSENKKLSDENRDLKALTKRCFVELQNAESSQKKSTSKNRALQSKCISLGAALYNALDNAQQSEFSGLPNSFVDMVKELKESVVEQAAMRKQLELIEEVFESEKRKRKELKVKLISARKQIHGLQMQLQSKQFSEEEAVQNAIRQKAKSKGGVSEDNLLVLKSTTDALPNVDMILYGSEMAPTATMAPTIKSQTPGLSFLSGPKSVRNGTMTALHEVLLQLCNEGEELAQVAASMARNQGAYLHRNGAVVDDLTANEATLLTHFQNLWGQLRGDILVAARNQRLEEAAADRWKEKAEKQQLLHELELERQQVECKDRLKELQTSLAERMLQLSTCQSALQESRDELSTSRNESTRLLTELSQLTEVHRLTTAHLKERQRNAAATEHLHEELQQALKQHRQHKSHQQPTSLPLPSSSSRVIHLRDIGTEAPSSVPMKESTERQDLFQQSPRMRAEVESLSAERQEPFAAVSPDNAVAIVEGSMAELVDSLMLLRAVAWEDMSSVPPMAHLRGLLGLLLRDLKAEGRTVSEALAQELVDQLESNLGPGVHSLVQTHSTSDRLSTSLDHCRNLAGRCLEEMMNMKVAISQSRAVLVADTLAHQAATMERCRATVLQALGPTRTQMSLLASAVKSELDSAMQLCTKTVEEVVRRLARLNDEQQSRWEAEKRRLHEVESELQQAKQDASDQSAKLQKASATLAVAIRSVQDSSMAEVLDLSMLESPVSLKSVGSTGVSELEGLLRELQLAWHARVRAWIMTERKAHSEEHSDLQRRLDATQLLLKSSAKKYESQIRKLGREIEALQRDLQTSRVLAAEKLSKEVETLNSAHQQMMSEAAEEKAAMEEQLLISSQQIKKLQVTVALANSRASTLARSVTDPLAAVLQSENDVVQEAKAALEHCVTELTDPNEAHWFGALSECGAKMSAAVVSVAQHVEVTRVTPLQSALEYAEVEVEAARAAASVAQREAAQAKGMLSAVQAGYERFMVEARATAQHAAESALEDALGVLRLEVTVMKEGIVAVQEAHESMAQHAEAMLGGLGKDIPG